MRRRSVVWWILLGVVLLALLGRACDGGDEQAERPAAPTEQTEAERPAPGLTEAERHAAEEAAVVARQAAEEAEELAAEAARRAAERAVEAARQVAEEAAEAARHAAERAAEAARQAAEEAEELAAVAARRAAVRAAEAARRAAEAARQAAVAARRAAEEAEERRKGFHCLSALDDTHLEFNDLIRARLNDPRSFQHDTTSIAPVAEGRHRIVVDFRAPETTLGRLWGVGPTAG